MTSSAVYGDRMPWFLRLLGARSRHDRRTYRMGWGELSFHPGWSLSLLSFEEHFSLHVGLLRIHAYVALPFLQRWHREPEEGMLSWGITKTEDAIHLSWGSRTKVLWLPWRNWIQVAHDVRRSDGTWAPYVGSWTGGALDDRHLETHPYRYVTRTGEIQDTEATIHVERRRRKLRWLRWLPFSRTTHSIDVQFKPPIGEDRGSWKGGCCGCGYELRPDETPRECLLRMQRERRF